MGGLGESLLLAALAAAPADAQVICPVGTRRVSTGNPAGPYVCVSEGPRGPSGTDSAAGGGATPPSGGAFSGEAEVPDRAGAACARFNAEFTDFHRGYVEEFGGRVREQDGEEARLRSSVESLERLRRSLLDQALGARDLRLRRHLRAQVRTTDQELAAVRARLEELGAANREAQERYRSLYEERARDMLAARPPGCHMKVLD